MLKHAPNSVSQGKKHNIELSVPPKFDYHSSPTSGVSVHDPIAAAEDKVPKLPKLASTPAEIGIARTRFPPPLEDWTPWDQSQHTSNAFAAAPDSGPGYSPSDSRNDRYPAPGPPFGPPLLATISSQSRPTVRAPHTTWGSQQASYHGPAKAVPIPHAGSDSNPQKNRLEDDDYHLPYERPGPVRRLDRSHASEILNNADNRFREDSWQRDEPFYQKNDSSNESEDEVAFRRMSHRKP